jgi:uncharacterized phage-associated protein
MLISREREKLIQAIVFFVKNTKRCGKVKLFKLLYFLDFEHFKATGRSVTGLDYFAWKMGPVPVSLYEEIDAPQPDMAEALQFEERAIRSGLQVMLVIKPQTQFSERHFSRREMSLMTKLAEEYSDADAEDMIEATHLENTPWDRIYVQQGKHQHMIPYELAARPDEQEAIMLIAKERADLIGKLA